MTRKKTPAPGRRAEVTVLVSFNGMVAGDTATVDVNERVQGWINAGLAREVNGGTSTARPGSAEPNDPGSKPQGAGDSGQAAPQPGPDPDTG
ncbi:hypothetical protein [Streptomyces hebeiensis]